MNEDQTQAQVHDCVLDALAEIDRSNLLLHKARHALDLASKLLEQERPLPKYCICAPPSGRDFEGPFDHDDNCVTRRNL